MMGMQQPPQSSLFYTGINIDKRVRSSHPLRKVNELIDFDFAYNEVKDLYGSNGNVSVPPPVILKLMRLLGSTWLLVAIGVKSSLLQIGLFTLSLPMARPLRIQYPDAVYHVTCRGNERQAIFKNDVDRTRFLQILTQSLNIYTVKLHTYVLMNNHFHLLVETPLGNLAEFMRKFNITYTSYYNRRHKRIGHLYQGRYKSILVDKNEYLSVLSRYIHLNPVRIKSMEKAPAKEKIRILTHHPWSSLPGYLLRRKRVSFVNYRLVLSDYGGDTDRARKAYRKALYEEMAAGAGIHDKVLGQSILGGNEFVESITERFLKGRKDRERPSLKIINTYQAKDVILAVIAEETGKSMEAIAKEKGHLRQIAMDLLYRLGGLKGEEIAKIFDVGYTSISQERRRFRELLVKDRKLGLLLKRLELKCNKCNK